MKGMNQLINNYSTVQEATAQVCNANVATDADKVFLKK